MWNPPSPKLSLARYTAYYFRGFVLRSRTAKLSKVRLGAIAGEKVIFAAWIRPPAAVWRFLDPIREPLRPP
jgi:hypothetical protein